METYRVTPRVRMVFLGALVLFAAQMVYIHYNEEPYPALKMPDFAGSGGYRNDRLASRRSETALVAWGTEFLFTGLAFEQLPTESPPRKETNYVETLNCEAVFITEGEEFSFPPKRLLEQFPTSQHSRITENALTPRKTSPPGPGRNSWAIRLRGAIFPGYVGKNTWRDSEEDKASLRQWLQGRARALVPDRQISRVEIRWFRERSRIGGEGRQVERDPAGTLIVPLMETRQ